MKKAPPMWARLARSNSVGQRVWPVAARSCGSFFDGAHRTVPRLAWRRLLGQCVGSGVLQHLDHPSVDTLSRPRSSYRNLPVQFRVGPHEEGAGVGFLRLLPPLGAECQVILNRLLELVANLVHGPPLKRYSVRDIDHPPSPIYVPKRPSTYPET